MTPHPPKSVDERGASAVEYGLLIAGIAALVAVAIFALGGPTLGLYDTTCQSLDAQTAQTGNC